MQPPRPSGILSTPGPCKGGAVSPQRGGACLTRRSCPGTEPSSHSRAAADPCFFSISLFPPGWPISYAGSAAPGGVRWVPLSSVAAGCAAPSWVVASPWPRVGPSESTPHSPPLPAPPNTARPSQEGGLPRGRSHGGEGRCCVHTWCLGTSAPCRDSQALRLPPV